MLNVQESMTVAELSLDIIGVLAELDEAPDFTLSSDDEEDVDGGVRGTGARDSSEDDDSMGSLDSLDIDGVLEEIDDATEAKIKKEASLSVISTPTGHVSTASTTDRMLHQFDELVEEAMSSPLIAAVEISPKTTGVSSSLKKSDSSSEEFKLDTQAEEIESSNREEVPATPTRLLKQKSRKYVVDSLISEIKGGSQKKPSLPEINEFSEEDEKMSEEEQKKATSKESPKDEKSAAVRTESGSLIKSMMTSTVTTTGSAKSVATAASSSGRTDSISSSGVTTAASTMTSSSMSVAKTSEVTVDDTDDDLYADPDEIASGAAASSSSAALKKGGPMLGDEIGHTRTGSMGKMVKSLSSDVIKLPELCGFLHKKSTSTFAGWQKRWVIVKRTHILWSKTEEYIDNPLDIKQRRRFQNSVTLLQISDVGADRKDKKSRIFWLQTASKNYEFKAKDKTERDLWLDGLKQHLAALKQSMDFINERVLFKTTSKKRLMGH